MVSKFEVYSKLAKHARDDQDFNLSVKLLEKALVENPDDYETAMDLLKTRIESTDAPHISVVMKDVERAFLIDPSQIETYKFILPLLYQNKLPEFDVWVERALVAFPDEVLFLNLAGANAMQTDPKKARSYFSQCVSQDPLNADHHYNCGITYLQDLDFLFDNDDKSIWHIQMALCLKPDWSDAKRSLVEAYLKHSKFKESLLILSGGDPVIEALQIEARWRSCAGPVDYDELISKVSNSPGILGSVLKNQCGYFEAMKQYDKAEKAYRHVYESRDYYFENSNFMKYDSCVGLGSFLCKIGKWDEGAPIMCKAVLKKDEKGTWDGEQVDHLIIHNYKLGFGDHMFYSRYVPLAAAKARRTTLIVNSRMKHLFMGLSNICAVTTDTSVTGDAWVNCADLVEFFGPVPMYDFVPTSAPAEPTGKAIINLMPSRNPLLTYRREFPFDMVQGLLDDPKYKWFSVCKQNGTHPNLTDLSDTLDKGQDSFKDTMKFMTEVDLVVTCCTSIAHLAGLMKRPCILLLTTLAEFRWGTEETHFDWYPTVKYVYQKEWGKWNPLSLEDIEPR